MKTIRRHQRSETSRSRRGAMMVLIVICLPIFLIFAAFSISIAYMELTRTELRIATDAATRAGSRTLSLTQDLDTANARVHEAAGRNRVAGAPLLLAATDIEWGRSESAAQGRWQFRPLNSGEKPNSLRVTGRRTATAPSGPVPLPFTPFLGSNLYEPVKSSTATHVDRDIALVVDRSGSMLADASLVETFSRWVALGSAVNAFMDELEDTATDEQVCLVSYASTSSLDAVLTLNIFELLQVFLQLEPGGATAIGEGMRTGLNEITGSRARPYSARAIVVMTDGHQNTGIPPQWIARNARDENVVVHTITFGDGANQNLMREVARLGNGKHWHATDSASLVETFREVANNLPTLFTE